MGKPSDRPEVPLICVNSLQVELLVMLQHTFVEKLEHVLIPSTANLHQDCVAAIRSQIRITLPLQQGLDNLALVSGLTTPSIPSLFAYH